MFVSGDPVCHHVHGVGVMCSVEELGESRFSVVVFPGLTVRVNERSAGILRPPISMGETTEVLGYLEMPVAGPMPEGPRGYRLHLDRLKSGNIYRVCDVVRELTARSHVRKLSPRVAEILRHARGLLVEELALVRSEELEETSLVVDRHLAVA